MVTQNDRKRGTAQRRFSTGRKEDSFVDAGRCANFRFSFARKFESASRHMAGGVAKTIIGRAMPRATALSCLSSVASYPSACLARWRVHLGHRRAIAESVGSDRRFDQNIDSEAVSGTSWLSSRSSFCSENDIKWPRAAPNSSRFQSPYCGPGVHGTSGIWCSRFGPLP